MKDELRLDADALKDLVDRQNAAADSLAGSARRLDPRLGDHGERWAQTPAHREAAAALRRRLESIADHLTACGAGLHDVAARVSAHAAAVTDADHGGNRSGR